MKKFIFISTIVVLAMITSCSKFPDVGNGYELDYNGRGDVSLIKCLREGDAPTVFIYGHILDYAFDPTFIVVVERPRDSVPECTGTISGMTKNKCDEAFEQSTFKQYWIINKKERSEFNEVTKIYSNVYGPFQKQEYLQKREELGIPKELKLKE